MATISANGAKGHHKFTLTVTEGNYTLSANTSPVSFTFALSPVKTGWDWASWGSKIPYTITINGTAYTGTIPNYDGKSTVTLKSGTQTVAHNDDGTKTINIGFSVTDGAGQSYTPGNASASGTMTLATIPRKATIVAAPNFNSGQNPTITYSNPLGNRVVGLQAAIANANQTVFYVPFQDVSITSTTHTFNLTSSEKTALQNATQSSNTLPINFILKTETASGTMLDVVAREYSVSNANPIVTASVVDTNEKTVELTGDNKKLIKYYSNAQATMSATPQEGAAIDEDLYIITNGNNRGYGTSHTFNNVESGVFYFSAEDSRGNVGTAQVALTMIEYVKPTCIIRNDKIDGNGEMTVRAYGSWFNGSFSATNTNTIQCQYRYKVQGGSYGAWADMTVTPNGNDYSAKADLTGLDYQKSYVFQAKAIDKLGDSLSEGFVVKSVPVFHWGENDVVFEVPVAFNAGTEGALSGDQTITGDLRLKGEGNYGNYLRFGDGSYCYIAELEDDIMTVKATRINLEANSVNVYGYPIPVLEKGVWTPYLNSAVVSSYTTQYGWYSKMGQTVTVGFFIKAYCNSGYETTALKITGLLPYTPLFAAAGGGMCSGAYISGGNNFQCFVAETNGDITIRVQSCNNTSTSNLSTSASGCFYRYGGGEITLSGTITYMANA